MQADIFAKRRNRCPDILCLINNPDRRLDHHYPVRCAERVYQYRQGLYLGSRPTFIPMPGRSRNCPIFCLN